MLLREKGTEGKRVYGMLAREKCLGKVAGQE